MADLAQLLAQQAAGGSQDGLSKLLTAQAGSAGPMSVSPVTDDGMTLRPFGLDTGIKMSPNVSNFLAGAGKAYTDVGQGLGQMLNLTSRADVADKRKLDQQLSDTTAGKLGSFTGNAAMALPTALIPGANTMAGAALINGGIGLMQPSTSTQETALNTGVGAASGPLALAAGRAVAAGYQGAKALVAPFFGPGQRAIAGDVLQQSATDPLRAAATIAQSRPLIPGSNLTTAQASLDPGLAQLERTLRNSPEMSKGLVANDALQRSARIGAVQDVAGRGDYYDLIKEGRSIFANQDYGQALTQGVDPQMAQAMSPQIESLLRRPSIQEAKGVAQRLAAENDQNIGNFGSVEGLDWLKKALDNKISAAARPGSSIGDAELRALTQTKTDLMSTLEQLSPAYKTANDNYAAMSRQVNGMDVARDLLGKLQKPGSEYMPNGTGKEMADAYMRALSQAQDSVKKATGMNKTISDVMPTADIASLENVAKDLGRKTFVDTAGSAKGSPTAQNLASQNLVRRFLGPTGIPQSWAEQTMLQSLMRPYQWAAQAGEPRIQGLLQEAMLDPQMAAGLLAQTKTPGAMSRFGMAAQPYLPMSGLLSLPLVPHSANSP